MNGQDTRLVRHRLGERQFEPARRRLFGIAYRMLGSVADAEDILQDVWIRWQNTDRSGDSRAPGVSHDGHDAHAAST